MDSAKEEVKRRVERLSETQANVLLLIAEEMEHANWRNQQAWRQVRRALCDHGRCVMDSE
jgi:hypothetical protein